MRPLDFRNILPSAIDNLILAAAKPYLQLGRLQTNSHVF